MNIWFVAFMLVYSTYFVEAWKRMESILGHTWLIRGLKDETTERKEFVASVGVDPVLRTEKKYQLDSSFKKSACGTTVAIFFIAIVILCQGLLRPWYVSLRDSEDAAYWERFIPSTVSTIILITFGEIYKRVAWAVATYENHRYQSAFEDSLAFKIYFFQFFNCYASCFMIAFYYKDFAWLTSNMITILAFKQLGMNVLEYSL